MSYTEINFVNGSGGGTPLSAANLNQIEDHVKLLDKLVEAFGGNAYAPPAAIGASGRTVRSNGTNFLWTDDITLDGSGNATVAASLTVTTNAIVNGQGYSPTATLTDGASIAVNCDNSNVFTVTLGGNRALANPTNMKDGGTYIFFVRQDATGSRTLSYGTAYKFPGGTAPTLTATASAVDILSFVSNGTFLYGNIVRDLR